MALSGNFTGSTSSQYIQPKITWSATQSVSGNYSDVTATLSYSRTNTGYKTYGTWSGSITINGTKSSASKSITITHNSNTTAISSTVRVYHSADGTKSITISGTGGISGTSFTTTSISGTITLDTIPRASTPTLSAAETQMGNAVTITTNRASNSFTHTLTYAFGSLSGTIATGVGASYSWTIPLSLANAIPNLTRGSGTIICKTYNGSTLIGTTSVKYIATVPASVVPSISNVAISEAVSGIASKFGGFVQNQSKLNVGITAAGAYSSTISTYQTTIQGVNYSAASFTSNMITASGTVAITTIVTDSRGRTATATNNISVFAYESPKIMSFTAVRCDTNGNEDQDGTRIKIELNFSISPVNDLNDKHYEIVYRKKDTNDSWNTIISGSIYSRNDSFVSGSYFDVDYAYDVALHVFDYFTETDATLDISTAFTLVDFHSSGRGIAFGKVAEIEGVMDVAFPVLARKGIRYSAIEIGTDLNEIIAPGFYGSDSAAGNAFINCPVSAGTFTLEVNEAGKFGQMYQKLTTCSKDATITFERFFYGGEWGEWCRTKDFVGKLLWSGGLIMGSAQTATLSENVSKQPNGIVIAFSRYSSGASQNYNWRTFFIPKYMVANNAGQEFGFTMNSSNFDYICSKHLNIYDDKITGHTDNTLTGTANGITFANNACVMRYVIGV